ncbi:hypothetical protein MASR2M18_17260 [Ignavibacteria bacterium]
MYSFNELPQAADEIWQRLTALETLIAERLAPATLPQPEFMTIEQVAAMLNLSPQTIYGKVHRRQIPYTKTGKNLSFRRAAILEWLAGNDRQTAAEAGRQAVQTAAATMTKGRG